VVDVNSISRWMRGEYEVEVNIVMISERRGEGRRGNGTS
jgi:hypothetical protein